MGDKKAWRNHHANHLLHRYFIRSQRFMDAYQKELNGRQAAWAAKHHCGHHVLTDTIMHDLDDQFIVSFVLYIPL